MIAGGNVCVVCSLAGNVDENAVRDTFQLHIRDRASVTPEWNMSGIMTRGQWRSSSSPAGVTGHCVQTSVRE